MNVRLFTTVFAFLSLGVAACSSDDASDSSCGQQPVGATCQTATRSCVAQVCTSGSWVCPANTTSVAVTPENCASSVADGGSCGSAPVGSTCKSASGTCTALVCIGGSYGCPSDTTEVAVTATTACASSVDGGSTDGGMTGGGDASTCGEPLAGATCQTATGTCTALICSNGSYVCPSGTKQVGLTPGSCVGDGGATDASSDH